MTSVLSTRIHSRIPISVYWQLDDLCFIFLNIYLYIIMVHQRLPWRLPMHHGINARYTYHLWRRFMMNLWTLTGGISGIYTNYPWLIQWFKNWIFDEVYIQHFYSKKYNVHVNHKTYSTMTSNIKGTNSSIYSTLSTTSCSTFSRCCS